jgi:hypothetical protein
VSATDGMSAAAKRSGVQAPHSRGDLQKLVIDSKFKTVVDNFKKIAFPFLRFLSFIGATSKGKAESRKSEWTVSEACSADGATNQRDDKRK